MRLPALANLGLGLSLLGYAALARSGADALKALQISNTPVSKVYLPLIYTDSSIFSADQCIIAQSEQPDSACVRPCVPVNFSSNACASACNGSLETIFDGYWFFSDRENSCSQLDTVDKCIMDCMYGPTVRLNLKSYGNHTPEYDARIIAIKPDYVIDNPAHGLYGEMGSYNEPNLLQDPGIFQDVGIRVIGYISGGYEGTHGGDTYDLQWYSLAMNMKLIGNMALLDRVDGVFIDECTGFPDDASKAYLTELSGYARSFGLEVWMNVGVDDFDPWFFSVADVIQSSEEWQNQALTTVQEQYAGRIAVTGFDPSYDAQTAFDLTTNAWEKGIRYCYINDAEYISMAPWFEQYTQMLRDYGGN